MKKHVIYWLAIFLVLFVACQKELSFEGTNEPAKGSLQADVSGDCLPKTVNGAYIAATALVPTANTIVVQVNVTKTGTYIVTSDTVNGYFFRATGTFTTLGPTNITLRGNGTPFAQGINNFVLSFDGTLCDIQVTVMPPGTGPATFTLVNGGSPANCASAVVSGTYVKDAILNSSNFVDITVNVTATGTFTIKATGGGMIFMKTGAFTATGNQSVRLDGTGTPTVVGANTISFDPPFASCNFTVTVVNPVTGTLGGGPGACTPVTINGTYTQGTPLTSANTVQVQITTAAAGPYSISTNTVAGMSFSASGTSSGSTQTITLISNNGTPTASGTQNFTVTFGTSTCTFSIPVGTGGSAYTPDCTTAFPDGLYEVTTQLNCSNTVDIDVDVTALGPYTISTTATNGMVFSASGTFTTLGTQTITLVGSGTPLAAGTFSIPMPGTTPCTFDVIVDPAPTIDWKFTVTNAPATTYQGQTDDAQMISNPPVLAFALVGSNSLGTDDFSVVLTDANGSINAGETYSTAALFPANGAAFQYILAASSNCSDTYSADPSTTGVSLIFTVTSHNVATKTITGTFVGTAKKASGGSVTITSGTFKGTYP